MTLDCDREILEDFLVETGEIMDSLQEQLVDLENNSSDPELLNSIFRGFHTIKGGASFLALDNLVDSCHLIENVFDALRKEAIEIDADSMDTLLNGLDEVTRQFEELRAFQQPSCADQDVLNALKSMYDN